MNSEELYTRISAFLVNSFKIPNEKITNDAKLREDLDLDSIDLFDLIGAVEREFATHLDVSEFKGLETLGELVERLGELLKREPK